MTHQDQASDALGRSGISIDLAADAGALRAVKRDLLRRVEFAKTANWCNTLEGAVAFQAGDAIVTGELGERWPVARAAFADAYQVVPPLADGDDGTYRRMPLVVRAKRLDQRFTIRLTSGSKLLGMPGDWLIQYPDGSLSIVAPAAFNASYDLLP